MFAGGTVRGLGNQIRKAERIRAGERWQDVLSGPKERSFAANCGGDLYAVTVDVHAAAAAGESRTPSGRLYDVLEQAYRDAAARHGMKPAHFQAAVWIVQRGSGV